MSANSNVVTISCYLGEGRKDSTSIANKNIDVSKLFDLCPIEFRQPYNEWSKYVQIFIYLPLTSPDIGSQMKNWIWISNSLQEKSVQKEHFFKILAANDVLYKQKISVLGWQLSQMLESCPILELQSEKV